MSPDDAPSAEDVRDLIREIQQAQVPTIFAEVVKSDRVINTVAREAGVKVIPNPIIKMYDNNILCLGAGLKVLPISKSL